MESQKKQLENTIELTRATQPKITKENLNVVRKALKKHLIHSDTPETRELLKATIKEIQIDNDRVKIELNIA